MTQKCLVLSSVVVFLQRWVGRFSPGFMPLQLFLSFAAHASGCGAPACPHQPAPPPLRFTFLGWTRAAHPCLSRTAGSLWPGSAQQIQELEKRSPCRNWHVPFPPCLCTCNFHHHHHGFFFNHQEIFLQRGPVFELWHYFVRKLLSLPGS